MKKLTKKEKAFLENIYLCYKKFNLSDEIGKKLIDYHVCSILEDYDEFECFDFFDRNCSSRVKENADKLFETDQDLSWEIYCDEVERTMIRLFSKKTFNGYSFRQIVYSYLTSPYDIMYDEREDKKYQTKTVEELLRIYAKELSTKIPKIEENVDNILNEKENDKTLDNYITKDLFYLLYDLKNAI